MKTYIETNLLNDTYIYTYVGNIITVHSNCNNNQCDCTNIYPELDYMKSKTYTCALSNTNDNLLDYNNLTDNIYYRIDFYKILIIFIILAFIIIWCPIKIMLRFFKRFN